MKYVHEDCLERWRQISKNPASVFQCDNCKYQYHLYRPRLAKYLRSEAVIKALSMTAMGALTFGSGSFIVFLSGEKMEWRNVTLSGLGVVSLVGLLPKLPWIVREILHSFHWHKFLRGDDVVPALIMLVTIGLISTFAEVYQRVQHASKQMVKRLGERVLEVQ